jgi:phosphatidylinositol glycan class N
MSSFTLLPAMKVEDLTLMCVKIPFKMHHSNVEKSLSGGFLMAAIGVVYLAFEKKILAKSGLAGDSTAPADNVLSRSLIGVQVRKALSCAKCF